MKTKRVRRQSRQRGTAMVELAIIAPLLIFTWAAINHFRIQYLMAQQVMHESRTEAWAHATSGKCDTTMIPSAIATASLASLGTIGDETMAAYLILPETMRGSFLEATSSIDARVGRTAAQEQGGYGFHSNEIGGRTFLHCNDKLPTPDDTLLDVMTPFAFKELEVQP